MSPQFTSSESRFHPGVWIAVPSIDHPGGSTEFRYQHQVEFSRIIPAPSLSSLVLRCPSYPPPPYSRSPPFPPIHLSIYSPCRHSLGVDFPSFFFFFFVRISFRIHLKTLFSSILFSIYYYYFLYQHFILSGPPQFLFFSLFPHIGFHLF